MSTSPASTDEVLLERIGTAGVITMTRPKVLNSLNLSMIRTMYPQLKVGENDKQCLCQGMLDLVTLWKILNEPEWQYHSEWEK